MEVKFDKENLKVYLNRDLNAPIELVWKAHSDAALIPKWWGPKETTTNVEKMDFKEGGEWRFVGTNKDGTKDVFFGEYLDIKEPDRITWTFNYEPMGSGHEAIETVEFEDLGEDRTRISTESTFKSIEDFEAMVESGMEKGARETWDRLEELLQELKTK